MDRFLSALLLVTASVMAHGAEAKHDTAKGQRTAVEEFKARTQHEMAACSAIASKIPRTGNEMAFIAALEPKKKCLISGEAKARGAFPDALKQMSNNPAASQLLKDFFGAWLAAFDNMGQNLRESNAQYEKRTADARAKYETLWKSFKKEAAKK